MLSKPAEEITLKWYKNGMILNVNKQLPFSELLELIESKFEKSKMFFKGAKPNLGFKGVSLLENEYTDIIKSVSGILGTQVSLWENPEGIDEPTEVKIKKASTVDQILDNSFDMGIDEGATKFYKKTVRSGQLLKSEGHIVIIGDVNPGAEIEAAGNIFVMGTIKGIVHAGSKGDRNAVVVALNLSPTQLRIADIITRAPDGDQKQYLTPEVAYIKDDRIFIEEFLQKKK